MNCLLRPLALAALALFASCQTPLGATSYPIKELPGLEGEWLLSVLPDSESEVTSMRIERVEDKETSGLLALGFGKLDAPRYRAIIEAGSDDGSAGPLIIDGEVVQVDGQDYLTFQKTTENPGWPLYMLEVPIQNTVQIELEGDELRLLWHEERYVWLPLALSGEMQPPPEDQDGSFFGVLMPSQDAVFKAYEKVDRKKWSVLATATRRP